MSQPTDNTSAGAADLSPVEKVRILHAAIRRENYLRHGDKSAEIYDALRKGDPMPGEDVDDPRPLREMEREQAAIKRAAKK